MDTHIHVKPLPYKTRQRTFGLLILVFLVSLPFLYLYATGYRLDYRKPTNLVSTGGIYLAVNQEDVEIYIDDVLSRELRSFRKAYYAQSLDAGTHRVHVQKEGYHTWVKELPVSKHLVTEAEAFNLPLVPQVRVISQWQSATGSMVVSAPLVNASSTNELFATTTKRTTGFVSNPEFVAFMTQFGTTSTSTKKETAAQQIKELLRGDATSTDALIEEVATTTIISGGVKLHEQGEELFATWVGSFEQMPYYYCAPDFPRYSSSTPEVVPETVTLVEPVKEEVVEEEFVMHPVQTVTEDLACEPTIRIDRKWQAVHDFDFLPGSTDFVIIALEDGVYVVEVDDRSWQNVQPLMMGKNLRMHIEGGNVYLYDGTLIYQVVIEKE
jgi:hypothetical protein